MLMVQWSGNIERQLPKIADREIQRRTVNVRDTAWQLESQRVRRRTGEYNRSFKILNLGPMRRKVVNVAKHGWFLEKGTRAHGPARAEWMHWQGTYDFLQRNGHNGTRDVYRKWVNGIKARNVLRDALRIGVKR